MSLAPDATGLEGLRQLQHDLLNPINVLVGATRALQQTPLDDEQRNWVRMLQSSIDRLRAVLENIERYGEAGLADGRAQLADLLSIAAARVAKPFDRRRLIDTIERVAGTRPLRILLVDDSPELAVLVRAYLRDTGWELEVVENGERGVAQATTERYDVVLMDIDLPGLDGAAAAHAIRAADLAHGASPTPIIAMTAFDAAPGLERDAEPDTAGVRPRDAVVELDDPEIAPLVPGFLENRRRDVETYRGALAQADFGTIQASAHKMKGTGRGFGLPEVSRLGDALEYASHRKDAAAVARLIDELDDFLHNVRVAG